MEPLKIRTREENFLAKIAGYRYADWSMQPRTAKEYWLNLIAIRRWGNILDVIDTR